MVATRTYILPTFANSSKEQALWALYAVYKKQYAGYVRGLWAGFLQDRTAGAIPRRPVSKGDRTSPLITNYQQICANQASVTVRQYQDNLVRMVRRLIEKSSLSASIKHQLHILNVAKAWYKEQDASFLSSGKESPVSVSPEAMFLMRRIIKHVRKRRVRFPQLTRPRLVLDTKVAKWEQATTTERFGRWASIATLVPKARVLVPVHETEYFKAASGVLSNSFELHFDQGRRVISVRAYKTTAVEDLTADETGLTLGLDLGLRTFLSTSFGELRGRNLLSKLKRLDGQLMAIVHARRKLGLSNYSRRCREIVGRIRGYLKTEIGRILNEYFDQHVVKTVVVESLNFANKSASGLSKQLRRIVRNFGQGFFNQKLKALSLQYGFEIIKVNPAYSSVECRVCHYVAHSNRKQDVFCCRCCGHTEHADVHASRNLPRRSVDKTGAFAPSMRPSAVLPYLKEAFLTELPSLIRRGLVGPKRVWKLMQLSRFELSTDDARRVERATGLAWALMPVPS